MNSVPHKPRRGGHIVPNSRAGRSLLRVAKSLPDTLTQEQKDWNAAVDAKKARKKK